MLFFWSLVTYSFFGFLLEVAFARLTHGRPDRKCLLVLPLCPVYGLGAVLILALAPRTGAGTLPLFLLGAAAASGVEYLMALLYERGLGVSFWDYTGLPGSLHGRICLPFSLAWGLLALPLVRWIHPLLLPLLRSIPRPVTAAAMLTVLSDLLLSAALLRRFGDRRCLRWYALMGRP